MVEFLEQLRQIETKWQQRWEDSGIFRAYVDPNRLKWFITVPYPYASGPLHLGHCRTYTMGDILARYKRQQGFNVLWPMAFHITGTPILSISTRIQNNDPKIWAQYRKYIGIYESDAEKIDAIIHSFEDPYQCAMFFADKLMVDFKRMGFSIDDSRSFTTGDVEYSQFIKWQYQHLMAKGYITKGSYPILWCPNDQNAVGEDDILGGDEEKTEINEFVAVKFRYEQTEDVYLLAATLRPETIYGATNIWLNPSSLYIKCKINNEFWIIAKDCVDRFQRQNYKVQITEEIDPISMIGHHVIVPYSGHLIPILPANFVDTAHATGIVYSVPAHAPYDYIALRDLQEDYGQYKEYQIDFAEIIQINPISIITVENYAEFPAIEACKILNIQNQTQEELLEQATQQVYKAEFYSGKMKGNTQNFVGLTVEKAKDEAKRQFLRENNAIMIYEPSQVAQCRCGTTIQVAVLPEQYFLDYGNPQWKSLAFKALDQMEILPKKYRTGFERVFDWLNKRPCVRKRGLGTEFPFTPGKGWIIESLSDSVIYMAFYTIIRIIREEKISASQLIPEIFDYIFQNKGKISTIAKNSGITIDTLERMKAEFEYWYPNDVRHTAVSHMSNHLSFAIFHHVAIFPEKYWLQTFSLNELLIREGQKMGKSKGNIIPIAQIPKQYSVDLARLHLSSRVTADTVIDWRDKEATQSLKRLKKLWNLAHEVFSQTSSSYSTTSFHSEVILAQTRQNFNEACKYMELNNIRDYVHLVFFENLRLIENYQKIAASLHLKERNHVSAHILRIMVIYLTPIIPHICEELAEKYKLISTNNTFISNVEIPKVKLEEEDEHLIDQNNFLNNFLDDVEQIIRMTNIHPKKIFVYLPFEWKQRLYEELQAEFQDQSLSVPKIMQFCKNSAYLKPYMKEIAKESQFLSQHSEFIRINLLSLESQVLSIQESLAYLQLKYSDVELEIIFPELKGTKKTMETSAQAQKAKKTRPMKPALYIE